MLDIKINGQSLNLLPNTALSFEQSNPLFQKEVAAEGFSYPIDIPTAENNRIFGFLEDPQSSWIFNDYACDLTIENITRRATLSILKATSSRYTCSIFLGYFEKRLLEKTLPMLGFGGIREVGNMISHANLMITKTSDEADYTFFPVWDDDFYKISDTDSAHYQYYGIINAYFEGTFVPSTEIPDPNDPQQGNVISITTNALVPFPYLLSVLKAIAKLFNKNIKGSFIADADIKQLVLFNTYDLFDSYPNFRTTIDIRDHLPNMTIRDFLNELIIKFGIYIHITADSISFNFKKDVITALEDDNYTAITEADPSVEPFVKKEVKGFTFSSEIDSDDLAIKNFADNIVNDSIIKGIVTFKNQLPTPSVQDDIYFVVYDNAFFKAQINGGNQSSYLGTFNIKDAANYKVGDGGEKVDSKSSTLRMAKHIPNVSEYPKIASLGIAPYTLVTGISKGLDFNTDKEFPLKFLFYRGQQPNYDGLLVPFGSSDVWNALNEKVGNLSMQWYGDYGLYERLHKPWVLKLEGAKALSFNLVLKSIHLANLNLFAPKRIDNQRIIIEKINYTITPDGIGKATARTLKI